jgi:putative two-component system response regulator
MNDTTQPAKVLVVDDNAANRELAQAILEDEGHVVVLAASGHAGIAAFTREQPDCVLLDVRMPEIDGFAVCERIRALPRGADTPVIFLTASREVATFDRATLAGADDFLTKPFDRLELTARVNSLSRLKRYTDELESAESVIESLALTVEARDAYTEGHCERLSTYAVALGRDIGLGGADLGALRRGGLLHDVGKIGLPDAVLLKPGRLTREEYELVKQHTVIGERLCAGMRSLARVRPIIRQHHERIDGSGYPDGLRGDEISLLARIIGVVDAFDAMTTSRPYRRALEIDQAIEELRRDVTRGTMQRDLVEAFIALLPTLWPRELPSPSATAAWPRAAAV